MVTAFPSLAKPITETNVVPQIKLLITNEAKSTVPTVASDTSDTEAESMKRRYERVIDDRDKRIEGLEEENR
eukprot:5345788-Prymnesium_polylepis.2